MKIITIIALLCWSFYSNAQTIGAEAERQIQAEELAQKTQRYVGVYHSNSLENQLGVQYKAWEKLIASHPQNAGYWLNYYVSSRLYFQQKDNNRLSNASKESLRQIAEKMDKQLTVALEKSFEKQLVRYYETKENNYKQARQYLLAAYRLNPKNVLLYPEMVLHYEIEGQLTQRNTVLNRIDNIGNNTALYKFSVAQLKTLPKGSVIFTNGTYDTYALLKASNALQKDIKVISLSLLRNEFYRKTILKRYQLKSPVYNAKKFTKYFQSVLNSNSSLGDLYLSATISGEILKPIAGTIYHTGFAYQYSKNKVYNISALYGNLMQLQESNLLGAQQNELLKNMLPAYILLYRHYKTKDEEVAKKVYYKAKSLAQKAGFWSTKYEQYFK
jgi:hypothetical protein